MWMYVFCCNVLFVWEFLFVKIFACFPIEFIMRIRCMIIHVSLNTKRELVNGKRERQKWANNVSKWGWPHTNTAIELTKKKYTLHKGNDFLKLTTTAHTNCRKNQSESESERERERGQNLENERNTTRAVLRISIVCRQAILYRRVYEKDWKKGNNNAEEWCMARDNTAKKRIQEIHENIT